MKSFFSQLFAIIKIIFSKPITTIFFIAYIAVLALSCVSSANKIEPILFAIFGALAIIFSAGVLLYEKRPSMFFSKAIFFAIVWFGVSLTTYDFDKQWLTVFIELVTNFVMIYNAIFIPEFIMLGKTESEYETKITNLEQRIEALEQQNNQKND